MSKRKDRKRLQKASGRRPNWTIVREGGREYLHFTEPYRVGKDGKFEAISESHGMPSKQTAVNDAPPPGLLIDVFVPASRAEDMLLEMEKAFEQRWLPKYGRRRARQIYLLQSTGAVIGYWINWIKQHLDVFKFFPDNDARIS